MRRITTLGFDVYGTLIDTDGTVSMLRPWAGEEAEALAHTCRNKQLDYSFRRGLMDAYADFDICTRPALEFSCATHGIEPTKAQKEELLAGCALPASP